MTALGVTGISKSEVSRICTVLDAEVEAFRGRPLDATTYPYLWLDALYHKVREAGHVVNMATLIAVAVSREGVRSVVGVEVAAAGGDEGSHWLPFLRSLVERGLGGVRLVISDAHPGLVAAIEATLLGASWQRCRVHFTRNAQALVPKGAQGIVASAIRSIFAQPDEPSARAQLRRVADGLRARFRKVAELLEGAEADLLAHFTFPAAHRRQIGSTDPAGAAEQGDPSAHRRGGHLPDPRRACSVSWACSSPSRTTSGPWGAPTSAPSRWRSSTHPRPEAEALPELLMAS